MAERVEDEVPLLTCPKCGEAFKLAWWERPPEQPETLVIACCESAGVYSVEIRCPSCEWRAEL